MKTLGKQQKSEFHPDWSMLEACQDSLREHMALLKEAKELAVKVAGDHRLALVFARTERTKYEDTPWKPQPNDGFGS